MASSSQRQDCEDERIAAQRAYALGNDFTAPNALLTRRTPQTPGKQRFDSAGITTDEYGDRIKRPGKNRLKATKHLPISPDCTPHVCHTPPPPSGSRSASSRSKTAFAGATFHASPAPSALPIPSFVSKSSDDSPSIKYGNDIIQEPPPSTNSDTLTPFRPSPGLNPHESPLDLMFRLHRQEKESETQKEILDDHSKHVRGVTASPVLQKALDRKDIPQAATLPQDPRQHAKQLYSGIDEYEHSEGLPRPAGPAFSTPYRERIKAARNGAVHNNHHQEAVGAAPLHPVEDPTVALKRFLFRGVDSSASQIPAGETTSTPAASAISTLPSQTKSPGERQRDNIKMMEENLRRILKIDSRAEPTFSNIKKS